MIVKIRMKSLAAGPDGVFSPGSVYEVDPMLGGSLVRAGAAELLSDPGEQVEVAMRESAAERAVARPMRGRQVRRG